MACGEEMIGPCSSAAPPLEPPPLPPPLQPPPRQAASAGSPPGPMPAQHSAIAAAASATAPPVAAASSASEAIGAVAWALTRMGDVGAAERRRAAIRWYRAFDDEEVSRIAASRKRKEPEP